MTTYGDIVEAVSKLLQKFSKNDKPVEVHYHKRDGHRVLFSLTTHDDFVVRIDFDTRKASKEYIDDMIGDLINMRDEARFKRHMENTIEIRGAVSGGH